MVLNSYSKRWKDLIEEEKEPDIQINNVSFPSN